MPTWASRCVAYYKLSVVQIIFLPTTNFTFPQAPSYNINPLTDAFRCSQKCQIKLTSCGLSLPAAGYILIREPHPCKDHKHPCVAQTCCDKHGKQVPQLSLAVHCSCFPTHTETQTKGVKLQIAGQMLLKLGQHSHILQRGRRKCIPFAISKLISCIS